MDAGFADHDTRLPDRGAVIVDVQRVVRNVQDDMRLAEIARYPAPAFHVGDDDLVVALLALAVERIDGRVGELAAGLEALVLLELGNRVGERLVVEGVVGNGRKTE